MYPLKITCLYSQRLLEYDLPPVRPVTGQIPSSLSTKITSMCAITVSPMHATCLTQFIHDFISHGEERKLQMSLLQHTMHLPITSSATGSNAPQTALHFICKTCWRKKDCYIKGRIYSKPTRSQKAVAKSFFSSGDNNQNLSLYGPASFSVEVFR